jgi:hypothetical protein
MKKKTLMLLLVTILFAGAITTTSCSKDSDPKKDEQNDDDEDDDDDNNPNLAAYLQGSDYFLIALDETTKAKISSKVTADYRVDEANRFLYVWENTYVAGAPSGPNAFGEVDAWISLAVASGMTWSGFGISPGGASTVDLSKVTPQHTLHFAMKSRGNATHMVGLGDGTNNFRLAIGAAPFVDGTTSFQPYKNFTRDGEWHHIEIPMSEFMGTGKLNFRTGGFTTDNLFSVLSGRYNT